VVAALLIARAVSCMFYEIRHCGVNLGFDLISNALPFGRLW